ncbi:H-NS histone family protein [Paraburkholderia acidisoli]|uniref:H-NS histone family protein n=1 Tax=Paraburkholderia acidisoli TaxID=2571748 RepID=A0A7Z2JIN7_9BURK|nr:H-NS histone family protein [Paraburkholderia acidisoli]QGZ65363.1 H-NS histone family protein [Paraburkholderia acidisoli]
MSDLKELLAQRQELETQLEAAFKEERLNVLDEISRKMKLHKITFDDIRGPATPPAKAKSPAKYRDPVSGNEWSGRGKPPNWIKDEPDRSKFLIDG